MLRFLPAPGRLQPDRRVYAIGDVHGCLGPLRALHAAIAADLAARPVARPVLVHLGDYVDRGEDSAGVLALLAVPELAIPIVNLMGNHESMLLDAITSQARGAVRQWMINGAEPTLRSWRIPPGTRVAEWSARIPPEQLSLLQGLALWHRIDGYSFIHAGMRPGVTLERQSPEDLLWIRDPFLGSDAELGTVVVHGHTPGPAPVLRRNRIGIDTGAVAGGELTCAVLEEDRVAFLHA
jgi:serine/threonine protein phosphatase 1